MFSFQKNPANELNSVASLLVLCLQDLFWLVSENWFLVSGKSEISGNFFTASHIFNSINRSSGYDLRIFKFI